MILRAHNVRCRVGGERPEGWLPPGAAPPRPTPAREVELTVLLHADARGYLLEWTDRRGDVSGDRFYEHLQDAQEEAHTFFGVGRDDWVDLDLEPLVALLVGPVPAGGLRVTFIDGEEYVVDRVAISEGEGELPHASARVLRTIRRFDGSVWPATSYIWFALTDVVSVHEERTGKRLH